MTGPELCADIKESIRKDQYFVTQKLSRDLLELALDLYDSQDLEKLFELELAVDNIFSGLYGTSCAMRGNLKTIQYLCGRGCVRIENKLYQRKVVNNGSGN